MVVRFLASFFILTQSFMFGQIVVTNAAPMNTEDYLVNDVLCDGDLTTSNFSSVGFANGIGYFDGFNSNIGFEEGIILSTGGIEFVTNGFGAGSGVSGDPDLELALNAINLTWPVNNVTILEFDFIAESESVAFNYVFGSSEYSGYTCTQFNDIFGFFLSGPGINGPYSNNGVNLAYIPDPNNPGQYTTTPVAVNTVNSGSPTGVEMHKHVLILIQIGKIIVFIGLIILLKILFLELMVLQCRLQLNIMIWFVVKHII